MVAGDCIRVGSGCVVGVGWGCGCHYSSAGAVGVHVGVACSRWRWVCLSWHSGHSNHVRLRVRACCVRASSNRDQKRHKKIKTFARYSIIETIRERGHIKQKILCQVPGISWAGGKKCNTKHPKNSHERGRNNCCTCISTSIFLLSNFGNGLIPNSEFLIPAPCRVLSPGH